MTAPVVPDGTEAKDKAFESEWNRLAANLSGGFKH